MLISELDLCKREWLELVFANRNKQYGAYELRTTNNRLMVRALGVTLAFLIVASAAISFASTRKVEEGPMVLTDVPIGPPPEIKKEDKIIEKPKVQPKAEAAKPLATTPVSVTTQRDVPMVATRDDLAEDIEPLQEGVATGPVDTKGTENAENVDIPGDVNGKAGGKGNADEGDSNTPFDAVEVMPQPVGGDAAWKKFLEKHLRYPALARENDKSGKVFLSFIVERDGKLSDISVVRKAGFGFDEEALRVLKMAPAWRPGVQNGSPVRVRYTIPIGFQLASE